MSINRTLPRSDKGYKMALSAAKFKAGIVSPSNMALSPSTLTRLNQLYNALNTSMDDRASGDALKTKSVYKTKSTKVVARMYINHFLQAYNNGVDRGVFEKAWRVTFGQKLNSRKVPKLRSEDDISTIGDKIIIGDATRVARGGAPMSNPTTAEVKTALDAFLNDSINKSSKKSAFSENQRAVNKLRKDVRKLIKKIWNEVETFFSDYSPSEKRDLARLWGVIYKTDTIRTVTIIIKNKKTGNFIKSAEVELLQSYTTHKTDIYGNTTFKTTVDAEVTFDISAKDFVSKEITLKFLKNKKTYSIAVELEEVISI